MEFGQLLFDLDLGSQHLKDQWGDTPLDIAKRFGCKQMEKLLVSHFYSRKIFYYYVNKSIYEFVNH